MKRIIFLLALLAAARGTVVAEPASTNHVVANRVLIIDSSSMSLAGGKAALTIGPLQRTNGVFAGDYKLKVFPYFLKNDKGRLAIAVSDAALAEADAGKVMVVTGTATTTKNGRSRSITATVTPADQDHGTLTLWFFAGKRKMLFSPAYHFAEPGPTVVPATTTQTNLATGPAAFVPRSGGINPLSL